MGPAPGWFVSRLPEAPFQQSTSTHGPLRRIEALRSRSRVRLVLLRPPRGEGGPLTAAALRDGATRPAPGRLHREWRVRYRRRETVLPARANARDPTEAVQTCTLPAHPALRRSRRRPE